YEALGYREEARIPFGKRLATD
ncbi:GNAT family N-acetyltransferase, partial [Burkholderia pseudomallei]